MEIYTSVEKPEHKNEVNVEVTNIGPEAKIRITISFEYGVTKTALIASRDTIITVNATSNQKPDFTISQPPELQEKDKIVWRTRDRGTTVAKNESITLILSDFESKTSPGTANIWVIIEVYDQMWKNKWIEKIDVEKKVNMDSQGKPRIHYFMVNPDYILHAGETEIQGCFYVTNLDKDKITLRRNNLSIDWEILPDGPKDGIYGGFKEKPFITSVYRLELNDDKDPDTRQQTVQVISPGWNQVALPQGYPANLFVIKNRLYGIFVYKDKAMNKDQAALYSSETGVDDWVLVSDSKSGDLRDIATSPGIVFDSKLWLIGGSSVEKNKVTGDMWYYELDTVKNQEKEWLKNKYAFPKRMGHVCVLFRGKILILGGYDGMNPLNDVWQFDNINNSWNKLEIKNLEESKPPWSPRCMFSAVVQKTQYDEILWIYGGGKTPTDIIPNRDLWFTMDGINWKEHNMENDSLPILPDPGYPLGATLLNYPEFDEINELDKERLFLIGSFKEQLVTIKKPGNRVSSFMFEWYEDHAIWQATPVIRTWEQFGGCNYHMQSVAFNRFIYVWSLHSTISPRQLNILIP